MGSVAQNGKDEINRKMRKFLIAVRLMLVTTCRLAVRGLSYMSPRSSNRIVIGAWTGNLYLDNSKYLLQYLLQNSKFKITWVANESVRGQLPKHPRLEFARKGSLNACLRLLSAKTWICCMCWDADLSSWPLLGTARCINLWHGIPIKFIGDTVARKRTSANQMTVAQLIVRRLLSCPAYTEPEWLVVASDEMADIMTRGVPWRYSIKRILTTGTPRNDFLIHNAHNEVLIKKLKTKYGELFGFGPDKKIVLYLPTWRMRGDCVFAFYNLKEEEQNGVLKLLEKNNAVLIEKHHYATYSAYPMTHPSQCSFVVTVEQQKEIDVQELLLIADVLISDYSGAYIDFGLLKRPVIHYVYDFDEYACNDSGLAYDLNDVAAGPLVYQFRELMVEMDLSLKKPVFRPAHRYSELINYEKGCACSQILEFITEK